jgi:GrpB-like predicted nucleotidyltransferase (UPF0157 family)
MKIYKFRKYKKKYPKLFQKEKKILLKILPTSTRIEHIGSTSVPNLGGKGIIDIIIGVKKDKITNSAKLLIKNNYEFKDSGSSKDRLFFTKIYGIMKKRRVHLHLTDYNGKIWKQALKFKNHLLKNKKIREDYIKIKKHACKLCKQDSKIYRTHKNKFIKDILKKRRE